MEQTQAKRGPKNVIQVGFDDDLYAALVGKCAQLTVERTRSVPMTEVVREAVAAFCGVEAAPVKWGRKAEDGDGN